MRGALESEWELSDDYTALFSMSANGEDGFSIERVARCVQARCVRDVSRAISDGGEKRSHVAARWAARTCTCDSDSGSDTNESIPAMARVPPDFFSEQTDEP